MTDQQIEEFFEMFPDADPHHHPLKFKHYKQLYKWLRGEYNEKDRPSTER